MSFLTQGLKWFQSTLPTRGSDNLIYMDYGLVACFNPRSPRGGATYDSFMKALAVLFQSTLPTRGSDLYILCHKP